MDIESRRIMGWVLHLEQREDHIATLFDAKWVRRHRNSSGPALQGAYGDPMRGGTMVATLEGLGSTPPSTIRPSLPANALSKALLSTCKYCPLYPTPPFADAAAACQCVAVVPDWYHDFHQRNRFAS